jgi:hypothetical protein
MLRVGKERVVGVGAHEGLPCFRDPAVAEAEDDKLIFVVGPAVSSGRAVADADYVLVVPDCNM